MSKLFSVVFVVLAVFLSGCQTVSETPFENPFEIPEEVEEVDETRTVTFSAPDGVTYNVYIQSDYGIDSWQEFLSLQGTQTVAYQNNRIYNQFKVESDGYRTQTGYLHVENKWGDGHSQFFEGEEVSLTFIRSVRMHTTNYTLWGSGSHYRLTRTFDMSYDVPLVAGYTPFESVKVTFEYDGVCEVYGDDFYFEEVFDVGIWESYPSKTVTSINYGRYNITQLSCSASLTPIAVNGEKIKTELE